MEIPQNKIEFDASISLDTIRRTWVDGALKHTNGRKTDAAKLLGITLKTLYNWMHEFDLYEQYRIHHRFGG